MMMRMTLLAVAYYAADQHQAAAQVKAIIISISQPPDSRERPSGAAPMIARACNNSTVAHARHARAVEAAASNDDGSLRGDHR